MKLIIIISLLLFYFLSFGQKIDTSSISFKLQGRIGCGIITSETGDKKHSNKGVVFLRCGVSKTSSQINPLYIVDGEIISTGEEKLMPHPDEIESIAVINSAKAMAIYGSQGMKGVIVITSKKPNLKIVVKDIDSKLPIPGVTIRLSFLDEKPITFSSNEEGEIRINTIEKEKITKISFSSVGYFPVTIDFEYKKAKTVEMLLLKEYKDCNTVSLITGGMRSISCGRTISKQVINIKEPLSIQESTLLKTEIFPNPVKYGQTVNIKSPFRGEGIIQLFSADGVLLYSQKMNSQSNSLLFPVPVSCAPGLYLIKIIYEKKPLAASGKIIIQ